MTDTDERNILNIVTALDDFKDKHGDSFASVYPKAVDLIEDALNLYYEKGKEGVSNLIQETIRYKKVISRVYDDGEPFCRHEVTEEEVNAVEIPKDATFGDVIMQVLKSAGNFATKEWNDTIYIYDKRAPRFELSVAIDKKLWNKPFQRGEKI